MDNKSKPKMHQFEGEFDFTVGKTIRYSFYDGFKDCIEYKYFVKRHIFMGCVYIDSRINLPLNKFFRVKYSIIEPTISELYLKEQITDSILITRAGFKFKKND